MMTGLKIKGSTDTTENSDKDKKESVNLSDIPPLEDYEEVKNY